VHSRSEWAGLTGLEWAGLTGLEWASLTGLEWAGLTGFEWAGLTGLEWVEEGASVVECGWLRGLSVSLVLAVRNIRPKPPIFLWHTGASQAGHTRAPSSCLSTWCGHAVHGVQRLRTICGPSWHSCGVPLTRHHPCRRMCREPPPFDMPCVC
jgi:hypothetical protein